MGVLTVLMFDMYYIRMGFLVSVWLVLKVIIHAHLKHSYQGCANPLKDLRGSVTVCELLMEKNAGMPPLAAFS